MKKSMIKALCCTLVFGISVTTLSIMNSSLTALAMEPVNYSAYTNEDIINYLETSANKIEIVTVGSPTLNTKFTLSYIEDGTGYAESCKQAYNEYMSTNSITVESDLQDISDEINQRYTVKKDISMPEYTDINSVDYISSKTNKEQTKAVLLDEENIDKFFLDENIDKVNEFLDKGYSIYFETDDNSLVTDVMNKLGVFTKYAETNENSDETAEEKSVISNVSDVNIDDNTTIENVNNQANENNNADNSSVDLGEAQTYAAYVIKNMSGDYFMGTLTTNSPTEENISNGIIKSMVNNRNLYSSYKDYTTNSSVENEIQTMSAPSSAWIYNGKKDCYIGTDWYNEDDEYMMTTQSYTSYGYMYDEGSRKNYYLLYTDYILQANDTVAMSELDFCNQQTVDGSINIRDYGPETSPTSDTFTIGSSLGLSDGVLSADFSVSYTVSMDYLKIETSLYDNNIINSFIYPKQLLGLGYPSPYSRSHHKQTAFVIYVDNNTQGGRTFCPNLRHNYSLCTIDFLILKESIGSTEDYNYLITPGCNY